MYSEWTTPAFEFSGESLGRVDELADVPDAVKNLMSEFVPD